MTTTETTSALAVREMSLAEIGRRINLNVKSGWGLERGTSDQLNLLALFCQKHSLLPGDDVTLYEGKPWITIDGRVKLMRRHKDEYRGHVTRPLSKDEKEAWGYDPDDLVVEATIHTVTYGDIKARGKVSKAERNGTPVGGARHNPVAKHNPVEMAEKRALSRAERYTFGTDSFVDDEEVEETARVVIQERNDPERMAANAKRHAEIFDGNYEDLPDERPAATPDESVEMIKSPRHGLMQELAGLIEMAAVADLDTEQFKVELPQPIEVVREKIAAAQLALDAAGVLEG